MSVNIDHTSTIEHEIYIADQGDNPDRTESSRRTREIEEFTNLHFIHPLAARITPVLARLRVSPNSVSITGMSCGLLAGWAYFHYQDIRYVVGGFLLMLIWHVLDGVDGQLARLTNRQSELGKIIDGVADNVTFAAVYVGLGLALSQSQGTWVWLLIAASGAAHSLQAAAYELQRQEYDFWGWDRKSAEFKPIEMPGTENQPRSLLQRLAYGLEYCYVRIQGLAARVDHQYRGKIASALAMHPDRAEAIRHRYRETFSSLVRSWSICSSNYRTFLIFLSAAFNVPQLYFFIELFVFTPLTMLLIRQQKIKSLEFSRFLDREA